MYFSMQPFVLLAANTILVTHVNAATNQSIAKYPYRSAYALLQCLIDNPAKLF